MMTPPEAVATQLSLDKIDVVSICKDMIHPILPVMAYKQGHT
jgi:hypothetical protein